MHAEGTYESRMSNLTSRCSQMESTAATVIASEVLVVSVVGRTRRWLPYMHLGNSITGKGEGCYRGGCAVARFKVFPYWPMLNLTHLSCQTAIIS